MSRATKLSLAVVTMFLILGAAIGGSYGLSEWAVARSQHQWCTTISLLASKPVPYPSDAARNPSRLATYELYEDFVHLRSQFRC